VNAAALFLTSLLVVAPGLGAVLAAYGPGEIGLVTRLALLFAFGYALSGGAAFLLVIVHLLHPWTFLVLLSLATSGAWALAVRRASMGDHFRALAAEFRAEPWTLTLGLLVIVGVAIVALGFSPLLNFSPSTSWRYWLDAKEIADAGRVPGASLQYGALYPPTVSKVFLNSFNAGVIYVVGSDPLRTLGAVTWLGAVGLVAALWSVARELGLRLMGILLPILAVMNRLFLYKEPSVDMHTYKAETFGRMVAFCAVAVGVRALRDRQRRKEAVFAGLLLGVAAGTHLVPVLVAVVMLFWYGVARVVLDREWLVIAKRSAVLALVAGAVAGAIFLLPRGDVGFQGSSGNGVYAAFGPNFDPTRYLSSGSVTQEPHLGRFYIPPANIVQSYVVRAIDIQPAPSGLGHMLRFFELLLGLGGFALAVTMLRWFPKDLRALGTVAWGLGATLVLIAAYFSYRYNLFILAWFGVRRLYDYASIPVILFMLALVEAGLIVLAKFRPRRPTVAGTLVVALVVAIMLPNARVPSDNARRDLPRAEPLQWIRDNTACDARILVNQRTTGIFQAETGRVAVLEGMAPYLRPPILQGIVGLLLDARDFLSDPAQNAAFLTDQGIDYVVIVNGGLLGFVGPVGSGNREALASLPILELVHSSPQADIYRVIGPPRAKTFVDPLGFPGYQCLRGPIAA
jgi:hypothetical protein